MAMIAEEAGSSGSGLQRYLREVDERWNPGLSLVTAVVKSPGYHTKIPDGARAHWTRQAMDYAIANLQSGEPWRAERANQIVKRILSLQVIDPLDVHFGIWGWFYEEPPAQMVPADWNWADFIGARIAQILICHEQALTPDVREGCRGALRRAAQAIFRRNVGLGYTNIAVMGGVVCAAAGEILGDDFLLEFGRVRLEGVVAMVKEAGGFSEYNSPTYTRVALEEVERALLLVRDPGVREAAERLRVIAWETIAEHFHPATGQSAGPQSRAYADLLSPGFARYLSEQTGVAIPSAGAVPSEDAWDQVKPIACPPAIARRFAELPEDPHEVRHRYSANVYGDTVGTTWFTREACIGSVTRGFGWVQQRPVLGYIRSVGGASGGGGGGGPAVVRVRVLKDGKDFSSSYVWSAQSGPRVLTAVSLIRDSGDHHITLDKPAGGVFEMSDLRVRVQLVGGGVRAERVGEGRYRLVAGEWGVTVRTPAEGDCAFEGRPVKWMTFEGDGVAAVDAVLHTGSPRKLDARATSLAMGFGLEVTRWREGVRGENSAADRVSGTRRRAGKGVGGGESGEEGIEWAWGGLSVFGRTGPVAFGW